MFLVPSVLGLQFRNRWRYICCSLARWFLLVRWFVGCWFCLFGWGLRFGALGVQFGLFVLSRWFGPCCFLLFDSALQGWGATTVVGAFLFSFFFGLLLFFWGALRCSAPAPTSRHAVVLFSMSVEADICYSVRFCWCSSPAMKENSCMQNCSRITCEVTISVVFLLE
jgi:hypothetical protein